MPARSLVLTGPLPAAGTLSRQHLATLVTADVLARAGAVGGTAVAWDGLVLPGGQAAAHAAQLALVREGQDRTSVGRDLFVERVRASEAEGVAALASTARALRLGLDVDGAVRAAGDAARAARTAFVQLYDRGLVTESAGVLEVCPSCRTVVARADAEPVRLPSERLHLRLNLAFGGVGAVEVATAAPELLPGAVAVAVPEGHDAAGRTVVVPVAATEVPVVVDLSAGEATLVVPAHDPTAFRLARAQGLPVVPVLDGEAVVRAPGPLAGLARHGARAAARRLLEAEGVVRAVESAEEVASSCGWCRTVLVPVLGRHWFLDVKDLETAAADAVRDGRLGVGPAAARERVLAEAGASPPWPLSHQLWSGPPVPAARCLECGRVEVSAEPPGSCGACMGQLQPSDDVLDARFVACAWALSRRGWPGRVGGPEPEATTLVIAGGDLPHLLLPMVGLSMRLSGELPFGQAMAVGGEEMAGEDPSVGDSFFAADGGPPARIALLTGQPDLAAATAVAERLAGPAPSGPGDLEGLVDTWSAAMAAAAPAAALHALVAALDAGVPDEARPRVAALAAPFLGA